MSIGEKPLISKWCLMGNMTTTTPPPTKPTYTPPTTVPSTTPPGLYLPPIDENGGKSSDNRKGKKLVDFVKEFNSRVSKKLNENPVAQISSDDIATGGGFDDDRLVDEDERPGADDGDDDDDDNVGEIDESFVDALAENYYYDYENQEIKAKNASSRKLDNVDDDFENDDDDDVEDATENTTTLPETETSRSKGRKRDKKRNRKAEERSDIAEENHPENSLVFEKTIPPKVKKVIDSSVRSDRKANIKVATAKGERANRSEDFYFFVVNAKACTR